MFFRLEQLTIAAGGKINADGKGYAVGYGPGVGASYYMGGTYGGVGGRSTRPVYGSSHAPVDPGSGGQQSYLFNGGSVWVQVTRSAKIDGSLTATGTSGGGGYGAGSGGGIYLRCGRLSGTGQILANGGVATAGKEGGGGGGGRIAIFRMGDGSGMDISALAAGGAGGKSEYLGADGSVIWGWLPMPGTVILVR